MRFVLNPLTGMFDIVGASSGGGSTNFSYQTIPAGSSITIATYQQMLLMDELVIQDTGELILSNDASLGIIQPYIPMNSRIRQNVRIGVSHDKQYPIFSELVLDDNSYLESSGEIIIHT